MLECILKIEFLLNLSKQIQEYMSKQVQNWVEEIRGWGGGRGGYLNQSLTAAMFLRMSDVIACTDVMWTLFTRMISLCETERNSLKQKLQKK